MRIKAPQLSGQLKQGLAPVYVVFGDEPLQLTEAADAIRRACRTQGIGERQVYSVMPGFDWKAIEAESDAMPLFSSRRLLDVRVPEGKVGKEGAKVLSRYGERPPGDTVLLVILENPPAAVHKARWFQRLEQLGVAVQGRPFQGREFLHWLQQRARDKGVTLSREALQLLALRTEGNLLAAAQEIDKLYVLHGNCDVGAEELAAAVSDSSRFDVFDLVDAVLNGQSQRSDHIVTGLAAEGVAAPVVLWAITRELRLLLGLLDDQAHGLSVGESCKRRHLWEKRRIQLERALGRLRKGQLHHALAVAGDIDAVIKGQAPGDQWQQLRALCLALATADNQVLAMVETG